MITKRIHLAITIVFAIIIGTAIAIQGKRVEYTRDDFISTSFNYIPPTFWQGTMVGEVTQTSAILRARLATGKQVRFREVNSTSGVGYFALASEDSIDSFRTEWIMAIHDNDCILKTKVDGLKPGTTYRYGLISGKDKDSLKMGPSGTFRTLYAKGAPHPETSIVVVTGMNEFAYLYNSRVKNKRLGYPTFDAIVKQNPDYFVATGDNVYYDTPVVGRAKTRKTMREKWHTQFATERFARLVQNVPIYWMKDDHDYRYNDADPYGNLEPSHELGKEIFKEQVPVTDPEEKNAVTYRTHRINDSLQIWMTEGRDYRDPSSMEPGPDKTMWGKTQLEWLKSTLLASDTTFKVLISPTPMVGPDDMYLGGQGGILGRLVGTMAIGQKGGAWKIDNQANPKGFQHEAKAFFAWLNENGLLKKNFYIVCGDRHWQYHSIHPLGIEEFSTGALVDGNSRLGPKPGDKMSTDPDALIKQPYTQKEKSGGFFKLTVKPPAPGKMATAIFSFYDENGTMLYRVEKTALP